jgi:hypothetical protein
VGRAVNHRPDYVLIAQSQLQRFFHIGGIFRRIALPVIIEKGK